MAEVPKYAETNFLLGSSVDLAWVAYSTLQTP